MTIIKRADLGRPLTWDELDDNFQQVDDLTAAASAAVSSASASATAAATSATASATSATDAANSAANAAAAIVSAVKSTITFTTGGTLNSNLDRISDGTYLYYWTGAYPVTIDPDSTVAETGGIATGFWAVDTDQLLRTSLATGGEDTGSSMVALRQGGTVADALRNIVRPEAFSSLVVDSNDWSPAVKAAHDVAKALGAKVRLSQMYKMKPSNGDTFVLPFDDGTYDTRRTGEVTLAAETQYSMPVGLNWDSGVGIECEDYTTCGFDFQWDGDTVDLTQTVGLCMRVRNWDGTYIASASNVNRMRGDIANISVDELTIKNAAIGIVGDGVVGSVTWGTVQFINCAIPMTWQGGDRCTIEKIRMTNCAAGFVVGGWWLTRNDISGSNTGLGVPPYVVGTDVYAAGWCDAVVVKSIEYSNSAEWGSSSLFTRVDEFFNTYFYKQANSARTSDGGRCTNTGPDLTSASTLAADAPFLGICKRAWSQLTRYHRNHLLNKVEYLKTWGCNRRPILSSKSGDSELSVPGCIVETAYIERTGMAVLATNNYIVGGSNDFVTSGLDVWQSTSLAYNKYWCAEGNVVVVNAFPVNTLGLMASARAMARSDVGYANRIRRSIIDNGSGGPNIIEQLSPDVYQTPPQKFIPNATGTVDSKYYWKHFEKDVSSQMTLYAGIPTAASQTVVSTSSRRVFMERLGNRVKMKIVFDASNFATGGSNPVVIGFTGIYTPIFGSNTSYALNQYGPVRPIVLSSTVFTVTDSGSVTRTFKINPVAYEGGSYVDNSSVTHYYFILQNQTSTDSAYRFLWSNVIGSRFQIELEYDTADAITASVF